MNNSPTMSTNKSSVLLVDDNHDLTAALARFINTEADLACAGCLDNANTLLDAIVEKSPDVVLLDLSMPGRDPLDAMAEAAVRFPSVRFVIMSGYDDNRTIDQAVDRGAWGFVSKHGDMQAILAAIRAVGHEQGSMKSR